MKQTIQHNCVVWSFLLCCIFFIIYAFMSGLSWERKDFPEGDNHVAFVLDVSKSMLVQDVWSRTRLSWAKQKIWNILSEYRWVSASLSIFAGESLRVLPFTNDMNLFQTFLVWLGSDNLSKQWTDIDAALRDAIQAFGEDKTWAMIVLTDGDEEVIEIRNQTKALLKTQQIDVIIIWIGTEKWWFIIEGMDPFGRPMYKTYKWERVIASLNTRGLKDLASSISARYIGAWESVVLDFDGVWGQKPKSTYSWILYIASMFWLLFVTALFYPVFQNSYEK